VDLNMLRFQRVLFERPTNASSSHSPPNPMRIRKTSAAFIILAGTVAASGCSGSGIGKSATHTFSVQADKTWQDTGIEVSSGSAVWLSAEGSWERDGKPAPTAGLDEGPRDTAVMPEMPLMCVLVRIGDDEPVALTEGRGLTPKKAGRLFAQSNELDL